MPSGIMDGGSCNQMASPRGRFCERLVVRWSNDLDSLTARTVDHLFTYVNLRQLVVGLDLPTSISG